jgi:predicted transglutaminase-like cysteine proteinase
LVHSDRSLKRRVTALTAGIGENQPQIRTAVCKQPARLGVGINAAAKAKNDEKISTASSRAAAFAIPTDEQWVIADEAHDVQEWTSWQPSLISPASSVHGRLLTSTASRSAQRAAFWSAAWAQSSRVSTCTAVRDPGRQHEDAPQDQASQQPEARRRSAPSRVKPGKRVANMRIAASIAVVAVTVGFVVLPACAEEGRPSDPFGNYTIELNKDAPLVRIWDSLRDQMKLEKAYFHECQESRDAQCPSIPALVQKLKEISQNRGKALLGHLNISINLMIKPASGKWTGPLEAITMRHGDCKSYSLAKYAAAQELGISADQVRLVIVHNRRHSEDHMVTAVHQDGEWFILDNLTNVVVRDWDDPGPGLLDQEGANRGVGQSGQLCPRVDLYSIPTAFDPGDHRIHR